ncbi:MucB/RseB C-terminal domain-containing protein [Thiohalobacter sp. IOR34]|uniref:MucB/RseB C-terminal domain-containing protein n=1 Tax=Thiohalobacter sp. IOR34 TaxID=3057176 RepID=UPI0025B03398|nr:MucB/RseB C-terminal domain-containing protein [Thiohalobacter sp. IOR34]WJW76134.1 MucB/RseB C-terminal domain-containing protein [Thiohalobacter sp. IOR34]
MPSRILLCLALLAPAWAMAADAVQWLQQMARAVHELNYRGTFVYATPASLEAMRLVHRAGPEGGEQRLLALSGAAREVIRDRQGVTCILPDSREVMVDTNLPHDLLPRDFPGDPQRLKANYDFLLIGADRVAGRPCMVVAVRPRDRYRYGYRVWVDEASHLPLRFERLDAEGSPIERMMFTAIEVVERIEDRELLPSLSGEGFVRLGDGADPGRIREEEEKTEPSWTVAWLPPGFELMHHSLHGMPTGHGRVEHLVYSDGLATLSVYVEQAGRSHEHLEGLSSMGAVNAMGVMVDGHQITVVGELPALTVQRVGESVRRLAATP